MVIFIKGRLAKGANLFEVERKILSALKGGLQKLGEVKQLSPAVVPTFQVGSLIVEIYDKFQRAGRGFERWFVIGIGDESNDGQVKVIEVKGASKVVPTALKILKQLLSPSFSL
jgi:hypothetical protein